MAVAVASELGRFKIKTTTKAGDFWFNDATWQLELTADGIARCNSWPVGAPKQCKNLKALMLLQRTEYNGIAIGNQRLDVGLLGNRLRAAYNRQAVCIDRPDNKMADNCPAELHDLVFSTRIPKSANSCGYDNWFHAYKAGTSSVLTQPKQLANLLIWAGWADGEWNPWIAFDTEGDDVKIDPIPGMTDGSNPPTTSAGVELIGFNYTAVPKYSARYSTTNMTNKPCVADYTVDGNGATPNCVVASGQSCPTTVKYYGTSFPTAPSGSAASPTNLYYCVKAAPN
jgi:hypothetical protein